MKVFHFIFQIQTIFLFRFSKSWFYDTFQYSFKSIGRFLLQKHVSISCLIEILSFLISIARLDLLLNKTDDRFINKSLFNSCQIFTSAWPNSCYEWSLLLIACRWHSFYLTEFNFCQVPKFHRWMYYPICWFQTNDSFHLLVYSTKIQYVKLITVYTSM